MKNILHATRNLFPPKNSTCAFLTCCRCAAGWFAARFMRTSRNMRRRIWEINKKKSFKCFSTLARTHESMSSESLYFETCFEAGPINCLDNCLVYFATHWFVERWCLSLLCLASERNEVVKGRQLNAQRFLILNFNGLQNFLLSRFLFVFSPAGCLTFTWFIQILSSRKTTLNNFSSSACTRRKKNRFFSPPRAALSLKIISFFLLWTINK